jgi:hypothetical protein
MVNSKDEELAVIQLEIKILKEQTGELKTEIKAVQNHIAIVTDLNKKVFVTHEAFTPVRALVYGLVALILSSTFVAILSLVLRK